MTKKNHYAVRHVAGFTLIELLVAMAIVAVVAGLAYPSYKGYTLTANRSEGKIALNKIAIAQERFFSNNNTYSTDISDLPGYTDSPFTTEKGLYKITAGAGAGGIGVSFILTATPQVGQTNDACTQLTLNSAGVKNGSPSKSDCWS